MALQGSTHQYSQARPQWNEARAFQPIKLWKDYNPSKENDGDAGRKICSISMNTADTFYGWHDNILS